MTKEIGGPAFPYDRTQQPSGMTLRDYFAAKAMQGMFCHDSSFVQSWQDQSAKDAYAMADAMLKARES